MSTPTEKPRHRFKPLPKNPDGTINKDKLKAQYMAAKAMTLKEFASELGYNETLLYKNITYRPWREQKISQMVNETGEVAETRAIQVRTELVYAQLDGIQKTPKALMGLLNLIQYMVQGQQDDAASDIRDRLSGADKAEGWKPKFKMKTGDALNLAAAADRVTTALQKALFLHTDQPSAAHMLLQQVKTIADTAQSGSQADAKQYEIIGTRVTSQEDMAKLLSQFYDRPQAPAYVEPAMPAPVVIEAEDPDGDED